VAVDVSKESLEQEGSKSVRARGAVFQLVDSLDNLVLIPLVGQVRVGQYGSRGKVVGVGEDPCPALLG
jgi:hypothetical protein